MSTNSDIDPFLSEAVDDPATIAEINTQLLQDPSPIFHRSLYFLQSISDQLDYDRHSPNIVSPIYLEFSNDQRAHLSSSRRGWRKSKGYQIKINSGFYYLLNDVAEITVAYSEVVSKSGEVLTPQNFSAEEMRAILQEAISQYVKAENIWSPVEKLANNNRERLLRELRLISARRRENIHFGRRLFMILFTLAHEIGHIVKGHCEPTWFLPRSVDEQAQELEADAVAAAFLIDFLSIPPLWWAPVELDEDDETSGDVFADLLIRGLKIKQKRQEIRWRYYTWLGESDELPASYFDIFLANALTAVASLFVILELAEITASKLEIPFQSHYPPARERYEAFRRTCIMDLGMSEERFTEFNGVASPPDSIYEMFKNLAGEIS